MAARLRRFGHRFALEQTAIESWLAALERLVEAKGVMTAPERLARVDAWDRAAKATPHGQPIVLSRD